MKSNQLYPIFLKVEELSVLIVGGGKVANEKLHFLLKSSPNSKVTIVAPEISPGLISFIEENRLAKIHVIRKPFAPGDIRNFQIIIAATSIREVNQQVYHAAKKKNILVNVADTPDLCDFYMGSIVTKGHVKIAISTNGKSPTLAKRIRQLLEQIIPDDINQLAINLNIYRKGINSLGFDQKVKHLNKMTENLLQ